MKLNWLQTLDQLHLSCHQLVLVWWPSIPQHHLCPKLNTSRILVTKVWALMRSSLLISKASVFQSLLGIKLSIWFTLFRTVTRTATWTATTQSVAFVLLTERAKTTTLYGLIHSNWHSQTMKIKITWTCLFQPLQWTMVKTVILIFSSWVNLMFNQTH